MDQVHPPAEQVAGFAHALGVGVDEREGAATQESGELGGVELVVLGFAAVDGFHVQRVSEHEGDVLVPAHVGEPVPGEHALDADDQSVAEGREGVQEGVGAAGQFLSKTTAPAWSRTQTCMVLACKSMPA